MKPKRTIFFFGSNTQGRHGAGAAKTAMMFYEANYGQSEGLQGDSYAIITKELRFMYPSITLLDIQDGVTKFLKFARANRSFYFMVTPIGCGLAGFIPEEIAPLFKKCPSNVLLPKEFTRLL